MFNQQSLLSNLLLAAIQSNQQLIPQQQTQIQSLSPPKIPVTSTSQKRLVKGNFVGFGGKNFNFDIDLDRLLSMFKSNSYSKT